MITERKNKILKILKEYAELLNSKLDKEINWFRNILTIAVGLFGILVSLKSNLNDTEYQKILFIITICTLALGILFGVIYLYSEIVILKIHLKSKKEYIHKLMDEVEKDVIKVLDAPKYYYYLRNLSLLMFFVSLISVSAYSLIQNI
ncbi:MAG: hypothetical protein R3342_11375 [Lutibacter sp.]|uniref:hypothetical protein n=1 Tax=Lutibacter sp. TaxID=1925666 RepID=UPI00299D177F|nr:hypothetical protein [Lutibacter sp.]MDX1830135.1 hypothetical protein [Lutibacter sp.]